MTNEYKFFECILMHDFLNGKEEDKKRLKARCAGHAAEKYCERMESLMDDEDEDNVLVFDENGKESYHTVTVRVSRFYESESMEEKDLVNEYSPKLLEKFNQKLAERKAATP